MKRPVLLLILNLLLFLLTIILGPLLLHLERALNKLPVAVSPEGVLHRGILVQVVLADSLRVGLPAELPFGVPDRSRDQGLIEFEEGTFSLAAYLKVLLCVLAEYYLVDLLHETGEGCY